MFGRCSVQLSRSSVTRRFFVVDVTVFLVKTDGSQMLSEVQHASLLKMNSGKLVSWVGSAAEELERASCLGLRLIALAGHR